MWRAICILSAFILFVETNSNSHEIDPIPGIFVVAISAAAPVRTNLFWVIRNPWKKGIEEISQVHVQ